ncbi:MAG: PQQ-dependent sugar dehydrogenase [Myxococcales bacterium]|nr:PQQ-dependent sugar dehydrogenase [Myxococcales bacterium]
MRLRLALAVGLLTVGVGAARADNLDPAVAADLDLQLVLQGLNAPTGGAFLPDGRLLITEQASGNIKLWDGVSDQTRTVGTVNVQRSSERGLLGLAVDPEFETSHRVYMYFSTNGAQSVGYAVMDPATGDLDIPNMTILLDGMAADRNHNGGALAFGPDGNLYIGVGDTGCNCGCAPGTNTSNYFGTCLTVLKGKVLRIDRDGGIPPTNPLVGVNEVLGCGTGAACSSASVAPNGTAAPRQEIYAWGFRNPWRFSFDEETGYLWIGDVGEVTFEEIDVSTGPGQHFGWPYREGEAGLPVTRCSEITPESGDCREPAFVYPRNESPNTQSASVSGGVFSNHCSWPEAYRGRYWFGDYAKARVWTLTPNAARDGVVGGRDVIVTGAGGPVHFMRGPDGAIYYLSVTSGTLWRIAPQNPDPCEMPDSGVEDDAGVAADTGVMDDAGVVEDTGVGGDAEPQDALTPPVDSGVIPDSGVAPDAGTPDAGGEAPSEGGCGCTGTTAGVPGAAMAGLLLMAAVLRRRR